MTNEEAARILDPETSREALAPWLLDCEGRMAVVEEACRMGAKALRAQLEVERRPQWVSVTERLPEDCADVLALVSGLHGKCTFERAPMLCAWFGDEGWFCNEYPDWDNPGVTHWMHLPEPPSTEEVK